VGDPLKQYFLVEIEQLEFKLNNPLDVRKEVQNLSGNKPVVKDLNKIPNQLVNVSGVYKLYHIKQNWFYIGSASSLGTRFKQHVINSSRSYRGGNSKLYTFVKENGGWDQMEGQPILVTPNHLLEF